MTRGVFDDKTGRRFGRLTAIEYLGGGRWRCKCDCGGESITTSCNLSKGIAKSCGCIQRETAKKLMTKHGDYERPLYKVWSCMKQRCSNPKNPNYPNYGGRGITICREWADSYDEFKTWAIENGYAENSGLSIDRIDVNQGYSPENCRWVTASEQNRNKRPYRIPNAFKPVCEIDEDGNIVAEYPSVRDASEAVGGPRKSSHIGQVCRGERRTAYGRRWCFADAVR